MINNRNFELPYCQTNQNKTFWWIMPTSLFDNDVNYICLSPRTVLFASCILMEEVRSNGFWGSILWFVEPNIAADSCTSTVFGEQENGPIISYVLWLVPGFWGKAMLLTGGQWTYSFGIEPWKHQMWFLNLFLFYRFHMIPLSVQWFQGPQHCAFSVYPVHITSALSCGWVLARDGK